MNVCPICGGARLPHNATCTRSHCQEAAFYACMAKVSRGKMRKQYEGRVRYLTTKAQEIGAR